MSNSQITLFTSLPPQIRRPAQGRDFGPAWQTACIKSWQDSGFRVVSLNTAEEIVSLRAFAPTVEFAEIPKERARPLISDFFAAAESSGSNVVGIINADCMMLPQASIVDHLAGGFEGMVIAERINLSQKSLQPTGQNCRGFDAFFFEVSALDKVARDDHWRIGDVWVDYWIPLAFHAAGISLKTFPAPILFHLDHEVAWNWHAWESNFPRVISLLRDHDGGRLDPRLAQELLRPRKLTTKDMLGINNLLFAWLRSREPLWRPEAGTFDDFMTSILIGLSKPPNSRILSYRMKIRQLIDDFGLRRVLYSLGVVSRRISL